ncbi:MAG: OmpA family protein, partial [Bacteroidota bacterium]
LYENPDNPESRRIGKRPVPDARVVMTSGSDSEIKTTDSKGTFITKIEFNNKYQFEASKADYLSGRNNLSTNNISKDPDNPVLTFNIEVEINPVIYNKEITLENIYYDLNKWDIRRDAEPSLNELAQLLTENPALNIQLASHTDCRAGDDFNQDLSQKRAQSAVNYLINKGIRADRLVARGYGESQPAINCACDDCTEDQHQQNRRTTFTIVK